MALLGSDAPWATACCWGAWSGEGLVCSTCRFPWYKHPTVGNFRYDGVSPEKQNQHDGYIYIHIKVLIIRNWFT